MDIQFGLVNLDLLTVGIAVAGMAVLGFAAFFNNTQSLSNRVFLGLALVTSLWGLFNYLSYQPNPSYISFFLLRWAIFFGVISSFLTFYFALVFPLVEKETKKWFLWGALPLSVISALATLTPLVFQSISGTAPDGHVISVVVGPGIFLFALTVLALNTTSLIFFIKKFLRAKFQERSSFLIILIGMASMLILVVIFNLILPAFLKNTRFVPLGALFLFPFIGGTAYAILAKKIFNIKITGVVVLVFALSVVTLGEVIFAKDLLLIIYRISVFAFVLGVGVSLIRGVTREVEQREQIEVLAESLKKANERLKELDVLKTQFLSIASHDLRAPLTIIRNFMSLLLDGTYGKLPPAAEEGARQVFERATDMSKSVDNYLNLSRIEQGRMKYDFTDLNLVQAVTDSINAFKPLAEKKALQFTFLNSAGDSLPMKADPVRLGEVLNNLLDNSIKYTPKGSISLSLERRGAVARIVIWDTGVGMTKATLTKLFGLFAPGENSKKYNPSSTGVGLYVVKAIVEAHRGKIWAESDGEGKGSRFTIELPITLGLSEAKVSRMATDL